MEPYVPPVIQIGDTDEAAPQAIVVLAVAVAGVYGAIATVGAIIVGVWAGVAALTQPSN